MLKVAIIVLQISFDVVFRQRRWLHWKGKQHTQYNVYITVSSGYDSDTTQHCTLSLNVTVSIELGYTSQPSGIRVIYLMYQLTCQKNTNIAYTWHQFNQHSLHRASDVLLPFVIRSSHRMRILTVGSHMYINTCYKTSMHPYIRSLNHTHSIPKQS